MKRYFESKESEFCYTEAYFQDIMCGNALDELTVFRAVRMLEPLKKIGYFYCQKHMAMGEKGLCGTGCTDYSPRNGRSGCCRHVGNTYTYGEQVTLHRKK